VRKGENIFKENFKEKSKTFSEKDWMKILIENPALIERPIIWDEEKAVIGRPPEKINIFLN
jgi:arsenate reductase